MSLRTQLGALIYDWPRFLRHIGGSYLEIRNRNERVSRDGRGVRAEWLYANELHLANVNPVAARMLMRRALRDWPIVLAEAPPPASATPDATFVIGHRGAERLPHLLATLRSIAGQEGASIECVVVEQSARREIESALPSWVTYIHTEIYTDYNRSATFNAGAAVAKSDVLILHDNDMLVPARYAAEAVARIGEGFDFLDLKRFLFYLSEHDTGRFFATNTLTTNVRASVVQNLQGGSLVVRKQPYLAIGGFDEEFVGWGGEDNDFWDRANAGGRVYAFGYLPIVHLWHRAQKGKENRDAAPAVQRYFALRDIPPEERIRRLLEKRSR